MARKRKFEEADVLDKAMQLFWQKGYESTSVNELVMVMGINKPSIYATFGDKNDLFNAALSNYLDKHLKQMNDYLTDKSDSQASLFLFFKI